MTVLTCYKIKYLSPKILSRNIQSTTNRKINALNDNNAQPKLERFELINYHCVYELCVLCNYYYRQTQNMLGNKYKHKARLKWEKPLGDWLSWLLWNFWRWLCLFLSRTGYTKSPKLKGGWRSQLRRSPQESLAACWFVDLGSDNDCNQWRFFHKRFIQSWSNSPSPQCVTEISELPTPQVASMETL